LTAFYPTLVIAIGGTGKSALLDVRQRLVSRFGSFRDLKTIGFLALDTDDALDEESVAKDPLADALALSASEHLHLTISENKMADIRNNLTTHHPALAKWLDKESLIHPSVVAGAGQIRQIGRLALLANIDRVLPAINDSLSFITSAEARRATLEYLKDSGLQDIEIKERPLRIFTVGSLIGGTGSGMFLDLGYLLREDTVKVMTAGQRPISTGIFAVPLAGRTRSGVDTRASAYAALRELNHFSDNSTTYQIEYPDGRRFETHEPPYDFTFLVSTQSGRSTLDGPRALVSMIGRRIVLEATSEFTQKISSNRDNIRKHLAATDERGCNQNFFTFGLSSIEVPLRNFSTACGARFMADTIAELRFGKYKDARENFTLDPNYLRDFLKEQRLDEAGLKRRLLATDDERESLVDKFYATLDELQELSGKPVLSRLTELERELAVSLTMARGEGGKAGAAAERIGKNAVRLKEQALPLLVGLIDTLMRSPDKRLISAKAVVESLRDTFEKLKDRCHARAGELAGRIKKGQAALKRHRRELEQIVDDPLVRFSFWGSTAFREAYTRRYARDAKILWDMSFEEVLLQPGNLVSVLEVLLSKLDELQTRVSNFDLFLDKLGQEYLGLAKEAANTSIPINGKWVKSLTGQESEHEDPIDAAYQRITGGKLRELSRRFLEQGVAEYVKSSQAESHSGEAGLFGMERRGVALDTLRRELWNLATREMTQLGNLEDTDVVKAFLQEQQATESFQQIARLSAPFLELDRSDSKFEDHPGKEQTMVGFAGALSTGSSAQQRFRELCDTYIDGIAGHHDERLVPLANSYQVIFYREYGAFPLRLWTHLRAMQQAYDRQLEKSRLPVHIAGRAESYLPIVKAAREDIDRLATLYLIASIPGIGVLEPDSESGGTRLDFTVDGIRQVVRYSGSLDSIAGRLYESEADGVPAYLESQLSKKRNALGDQEYVRHILAFRNSLYDLQLSGEARDRQLALIDNYLSSDRGLLEARQAAGASGPTSPSPAASGSPAGPSGDTSSNGDSRPAAPAAAAAAEAAAGPSIPDQIRKLGELKEQGLLTEEEFASKKKELLDRM
jgi:hypothetical protein